MIKISTAACLLSGILTVLTLTPACTPDADGDGSGDESTVADGDANVGDAAAVGTSNEVKPNRAALSDAEGTKTTLDTDANVTTIGESDDTENLQRGLLRTAPVPTLLDADALTTVYTRIFMPADPQIDATGSWFSGVEKKALGAFDFTNRNADQRNLARSGEMSLPYMRALRGFLSRGCGNLVDRELLAVSQNNAEANIFVHGARVPTEAEVAGLMRSLFGQATGAVYGAGEFQEVFAANYVKAVASGESAADLNLRLVANYKLLCIAVGMDPRAYLR